MKYTIWPIGSLKTYYEVWSPMREMNSVGEKNVSSRVPLENRVATKNVEIAKPSPPPQLMSSSDS